jgi:hypothetical protein
MVRTTTTSAPIPISRFHFDALQEFSVQTSNYNAEDGGNAGGVNTVTKPGTNSLHGDCSSATPNSMPETSFRRSAISSSGTNTAE